MASLTEAEAAGHIVADAGVPDMAGGIDSVAAGCAESAFAGAGSPPAKASSSSTTPGSLEKKAGAGRPKKAKEGASSSSKKAAPSPAASGMRGISSFLVPIAKKAKTDEQGAQAKASQAETGNDAQRDAGMAPADEAAPAEPQSAAAAEVQEQPAASTAPAAQAQLSPRPAQKQDFVNLVSPASSPSKAQPDAGQSQQLSPPAAKRQCLPKDSVVGGESKPVTIKEVKESPPAPSSADKEARLGMLRDELSGLGLVKLSGDAIPALRPSASDMMNDFDLDAIRNEEVKPMSMKTRQVMARFLEGSARTIKEVAALLLVGAANKPSEDEEADCMVKIEESINTIAHLVERRPKISEGKVQGEGAVKRWEVKDMADIPDRFRALVETHRKMEVALCERIKLIETLVADLSSSKCKSTAKLDKNLVFMKDKYLKLEEKEKKEREKLEAKLETERKKEQDKLEAKLEAERKKQQQREEKEKAKEAKSESKEKDTEWSANTSEKVETKTSKAKTCDKSETKTAKKGKKLEPTKGEASSIMSFFGKSAVASAPKSAVPHAHSTSEDKTSAAGTHSQKERRNFHPWEKPKNAVVASFPFGPAAESNRKSRSAASADLASWLEVLRSETVRTVRQRPMREDGTPHPKMKLIQLNMKIPVVKTQLIDVDIEAEKKIHWDVEWDDAEDKLNEIMANVEQQDDGLFKYQGHLLQMLTEGGGWFDCRRPAYYGTNSKTSKVINARQPLVQDPELDYSYESDADWESEMGDGEDIGSDLDGDDEEEEEDEDGGFVVPDGYGSDDCEGEDAAKSKKRKLEQIVHYRSLPADLAEMLTVQVIDKLPLSLSSDPNIHLDENTDYYGLSNVVCEDIFNSKAPNLDAAIQFLHKHPTAVAFTYILPDSEHKLRGTVFLKGKKPTDETKTELVGVISGYLYKVPEHKTKAVWKEMLATPAETVTPAAKVENSSKQAAAAKLKISDAHLLAIVKLVHGSARSKNDLVQALIEVQSDIPKSRAEKIIGTVAQKKVEQGASRWVLLEETLKRSAFIEEIAKDAWKANISQKIPTKAKPSVPAVALDPAQWNAQDIASPSAPVAVEEA